MAGPNPTASPLLDRLLFRPGEAQDPEARFVKASFFLVILVSILGEALLILQNVISQRPAAVVLHAGLTLAAVFSLVLFRLRFQVAVYSGGFLVLGLVSQFSSLVIGMGYGALLWHLILPLGILILNGTRWGLPALAGDIGLALVQSLVFPGRFEHLAGQNVPVWALVLGWEAAAVFLFGAVMLFFSLVRQSLLAYRQSAGETLNLLTETKDSEARWAHQARFLETLMDVIPFPIFHKGNDGAFLRSNDAFRVVFDVNREAVVGRHAEQFLAPENAKALAKIELDVLARDSMAVEEAVLIHADGQPHNFIVYLVPFVDEGQALEGSIGVLIDISERKKKEERLVQLNSTKDQLFSIISHDLRGPVGKLKQLLDVYIDDPSVFDKATWDQVFHDMRRSTDSLFQLLENLLEWARSQQGEELLRFESVPLEPLVGEIFSVLKLLANEKRISLTMKLNLNTPLLTDRHLLSTILRNLVHNALKFTPAGGRVQVRAEETPDAIYIDVRDTGVGMSPEVLERLFDKKESLTTFGTAKERGRGLGLGLCRSLAEALGATLEARSRVGEGTSIRLSLATPEL